MTGQVGVIDLSKRAAVREAGDEGGGRDASGWKRQSASCFPPFAEDQGQNRLGPARMKGAGPSSGLIVILVDTLKAQGFSEDHH